MTSERATKLRFLGAGLVLLLKLTGNVFGQDFIKENPDFEKMYNGLTPQNRDLMLKYLLSMPSENRKTLIEEMVKIDTEVKKNRISVEHVSAKLLPSAGNETTLTATSFDPKVQPLTSAFRFSSGDQNLKIARRFSHPIPNEGSSLSDQDLVRGGSRAAAFDDDAYLSASRIRCHIRRK